MRRKGREEERTISEEYKEERRYPWTSEELFLKICEILQEKGLMPENLAYCLPTSPQLKITTDDFRLRNNLWYGRTEGIYLDVFLEFEGKNEKVETKGLGTFKSLDASDETMYAMSMLLADFIIELREFTNAHQSDFIWEGFNVYLCNESGERMKLILFCDDMEVAFKLKDKLLEKYPVIEIQDNGTRKMETYKRTDKNLKVDKITMN